MINIRTQADFNSIQTYISSETLIRIHALPDGASYTTTVGFTIARSNIVIEGVNNPKITFTGASNVDIINITGTSASYLVNVVISGLHLIGKPTIGKCGIYVNFVGGSSQTRGKDTYSTRGVVIENCTIEDTKTNGIEFVATVNNSTIRNCTVKNVGNAGIWLASASFFTIVNNKIINAPMSRGIYVASGSFGLVAENIIHNCNIGIQVVSHTQTIVRSNHITNSVGIGLSISNASYNPVTNNTIINSSTQGIMTSASHGYVASNNVLINNQGAGFISTGCNNANIFSNKIQASSLQGIHINGTTDLMGVLANILTKNNGAGMDIVATNGNVVGNLTIDNGAPPTIAGTGTANSDNFDFNY